MGGQAFTNLNLSIPRLPPDIYENVKKVALETLSKHYAKAAAIPEAPGKQDYGDIDLAVGSPYSPSALDDTVRDLPALHVKVNFPEYHLATPLPLDQNRSDCNTSNHSKQQQAFAQIDIRVCPTEDLDWILFLHGHGDLGQILGVMNYGYGFTSNDKGFHVRIKEQEGQNWKASQVFLTKNPDMLMDFMRLDKEEYARGFQSEQHLFAWLTTCRLLDRNSIDTRKDDSDNRARMQKRPMFRRFVSDCLPNPPSSQVTSTHTRESLLHEALVFFDKEEEYTTRRDIVLATNAEEHAWHLITSTVLEPDTSLRKAKLNEVVRAFKRFVAFTADQPYIREEAEMEPDRQAHFCVMINEDDEVDPEMRKWLLANWQEVKTLERERVKGKRRLAMRVG